MIAIRTNLALLFINLYVEPTTELMKTDASWISKVLICNMKVPAEINLSNVNAQEK